MTTVTIEDYLSINDTSAVDLARKLRASPQLIHYWRSLGRSKVYIDFDVKTKEISQVYSQRELWSKK